MFTDHLSLTEESSVLKEIQYNIDSLIYQLENTIKPTKEHTQIKNYLESCKEKNLNFTSSQLILFKNFISEFEQNTNAGNSYPFGDRFEQLKNIIESDIKSSLTPSLRATLSL